MKKFYKTGILLVLITIFCSKSYAYECFRPNVEKIFESADVVVLAKNIYAPIYPKEALAKNRGSGFTPAKYEEYLGTYEYSLFKVEFSFKGSDDKNILHVKEDAFVGMGFTPGDSYVIFLKRLVDSKGMESDAFSIDVCLYADASNKIIYKDMVAANDVLTYKAFFEGLHKAGK